MHVRGGFSKPEGSDRAACGTPPAALFFGSPWATRSPGIRRAAPPSRKGEGLRTPGARTGMTDMLPVERKFMLSHVWHSGECSGTTHGTPRMQGARRAGGPAPLREGGGAAMNGRMIHGKRQAAGAATGGVLRLAVAASTTFHRQETNQSLCGWTMRKPASTAPRSTPPAALSFHSALAIHKPSSSGRHPPLGGGRMLAHSPFSKYLSMISRKSAPSTIIPEEPNFFQSLENGRKFVPIVGKNRRNFPTIGKKFSNRWKSRGREGGQGMVGGLPRE